jgi:hypothetical protein
VAFTQPNFGLQDFNRGDGEAESVADRAGGGCVAGGEHDLVDGCRVDGLPLRIRGGRVVNVGGDGEQAAELWRDFLGARSVQRDGEDRKGGS